MFRKLWFIKIVLGILLFSLNVQAVEYDFGSPDDTVAGNSDDAIGNIIQENIPTLHVVYNITRGVEMATVSMIDGGYMTKLMEFPVHGGRNQLEINDKNELTCTFTTTGRLQPSLLDKNHRSRDWVHGGVGSPMPNYIQLDAVRGLGAHQGPLFNKKGVPQYSGGCIRETKEGSAFVFQQVQLILGRKADTVNIAEDMTSNLIFDVIDNTPGRDEAYEKCKNDKAANRRNLAANRGGGHLVSQVQQAPVVAPRTTGVTTGKKRGGGLLERLFGKKPKPVQGGLY